MGLVLGAALCPEKRTGPGGSGSLCNADSWCSGPSVRVLLFLFTPVPPAEPDDPALCGLQVPMPPRVGRAFPKSHGHSGFGWGLVAVDLIYSISGCGKVPGGPGLTVSASGYGRRETQRPHQGGASRRQSWAWNPAQGPKLHSLCRECPGDELNNSFLLLVSILLCSALKDFVT